MKPLTRTQLNVLRFVIQHIALAGYAPTRAEIARHFAYRSPNAAECHLRALAAKGAISMTPGISRGLRVVEGAG